MSDLVWNEERANLSVQARYSGHVELPENTYKELPKEFKTNIFRNYTLIKDGIVHTYNLPVSLSQNTFVKLQSNGLLIDHVYQKDFVYILNFQELPVVNRKMIKEMSAEELCLNEFELLNLKANNSVFNHFKKERFEGLSRGFAELYGEEATAWLKGLGIASYGFNPPSDIEKIGEQINVNTLSIKVDKMSLMTSATDFKKVLEKYKKKVDLTSREQLLVPAIEEYNKFMETMKGVEDDKIVNGWLEAKSKYFRKTKNDLMVKIAQQKFLAQKT